MREAVLYKIFLDLQEAYGALDQDRYIEILTMYGVGPRAIQLLRTYWGRNTILAKGGIYYSPQLKEYHRVTHGEPLYSSIFNMVVDTVIHHWVMVVAATDTPLVALIQDLAAYFHVEDGLVA